MNPKPIYNRILIKISGEVLAGTENFGICFDVVHTIAQDIKELHDLGIEIGIVLGGGNIFRGLAGSRGGIDRVTGDHMGMLATVINALALQDALEKQGVYTRVMSAIQMNEFCEPYIRRRAIRHLEKGRVIIMTAGTGNPYFTTDTAAALRAIEIEAEVLFKGTKVDGIYDRDPVHHDNAIFFDRITHHEILTKNLRAMDSTAISLCQENKLPIQVFNIKLPKQIRNIVLGEKIGTLISTES